MTLTATQSALTANLAALGERNPDLVELLRAARPIDGLAFDDTDAGVPTATLAGTRLASRRSPLDEAERLAATADVVENAVIVVLGFGLGYHVAVLARRMKKTGVVLVFEPDVALLRSVFERIDHADWLREANVLFVTDADDRAVLGKMLAGAEAILGQGIAFVEHPASRARLGDRSRRFSSTFAEFVTTAKTTLVTTLVRSIDTVRNLLHNVDHYVGGPGVADLKDTARECPAVVVAAGPSLAKNLHLLARPGVRERCAIIAVQTALKPLLEAGVRPHFVTALDFHEISRRFYEGLTAEDVDGVTLVVDPKAHPAILDAFPGPVRCCANGFLDRLLGPLARDMGELPSGATVAHLAVYLARWLGCRSIALMGQDLGFPDGLYYAPGTAIHDVWAPELNPFNTIAMMEWQRIVRYRPHLHKTVDVNGRSIYTDAQMLTYLQQFERDFADYAREGVEIIDATEGGVVKQGAPALSLGDFLARSPARPLPDLSRRGTETNAPRLREAETRFTEVRREMGELRAISRRTARVLRKMQRDQSDPARMARHFEKIDRARNEVAARRTAFDLLNQLNQMGMFKRLSADRRIDMRGDLTAIERQRAQLERDLENVVWLADAAEELATQLEAAGRLVRGETVPFPAPLIDPADPGPARA